MRYLNQYVGSATVVASMYFHFMSSQEVSSSMPEQDSLAYTAAVNVDEKGVSWNAGRMLWACFLSCR